MAVHIDVLSRFGQRIRTTKRHWDYIVSKHDSVAGLEKQVEKALANPGYVRLSRDDRDVFLYYARHKKYYLCVVCRHLNGDGFIITAYVTDKIKKGVTVYEADKD